MSARETSRRLIDDSLTMAREGDIEAGRAGLDRLAHDRALLDRAELGPATALGLPRKLHAAYLKLAKIAKDRSQTIALQYTLVPPPPVLLAFSHFDSVERRTMAALNRQPVPRILHQIWLGSLALPPATEAWAEHCARHGLTYRLWREADLNAAGMDQHPSFQAMLARGDYPGAVDVARYLILERFGGIYLDCDWYPARDDISFADCLALTGLAALAEDIPRQTGVGSLLLTNSFLASPPGHPVFTRIIAAMPQAMAALPDAPAWWSTGPLLMTVVFRGTSFSLPDARFVAATLERKAPFAAVETVRADAMRDDGGLLIGWKSW
ncbi:mannosyltransferase OCH1-like enzyme [Agrobacterium vitis]|nr:mannosyltransferase OCH1-like enzyme [Agrobacterium vitis]MBE1440062.1 mannosyltransferase OCH1-like enzyme [Agrobacterium vitis]